MQPHSLAASPARSVRLARCARSYSGPTDVRTLHGTASAARERRQPIARFVRRQRHPYRCDIQVPIDLEALASRKSSILLRKIVGAMFMRVKLEVRPAGAPTTGLDTGSAAIG